MQVLTLKTVTPLWEEGESGLNGFPGWPTSPTPLVRWLRPENSFTSR